MADLMPSVLWQAQAALFALFTEVFEGDDVTIFDGARTRGTTPQQFLIVGASDLEPDVPHARAVQQTNPMAGGWRDEVGEIDCTAVAWSGDTNIAPLRTAVQSIVNTCETAVNTAPDLGGLLKMGNFAELTGLELREAQTDKGPFVIALFTVTYTTVLTS